MSNIRKHYYNLKINFRFLTQIIGFILIPCSIKLMKSKDKVQFSYENGKYLILSSAFLRSASPSSENKKHARNPDFNRFKSVKILDLEKVGNYAIRFFFNDNHSTGIYSWDYIIEIGKLSQNS